MLAVNSFGGCFSKNRFQGKGPAPAGPGLAVGGEGGTGASRPVPQPLLGFPKRSPSLFSGLEKVVLEPFSTSEVAFLMKLEALVGFLGGVGEGHVQFLSWSFCQFSSSSPQESRVSFKIVSMLN